MENTNAGKINMAAASDTKVEIGGFSCCVPNCHNNSRKNKGTLSFYVFPKDEKLREEWLKNISRQNFVPGSGHRVCSEHFEDGKKTYINNVPTIFPPKKESFETEVEQGEQLEQFKNVEQLEQLKDCEEQSEHRINELRLRIAELERENKDLNNRLSVERVGVERYALSDSDMQFYTGLTNYQQFKAVYDFLDGDAGVCSKLTYWGSVNTCFPSAELNKRGRKRSLLPVDELFLTMTRLRVNMPEKVLADQFRLSVPEVSRIFVTWLDCLYTRLVQLPIWASRQTVDRTMPECFKVNYPSTRVILDCTEMFIERPSCFRVQAETYSSYKSHNTGKGLVGIAPNGAVTFVSELYGGHSSDKEIVKASGIISLVEPGDSVMADRGFDIQDLLVIRKVVLNIPPFMRCKEQLDPDEEEETREIAAVRIHVERAIARIKNYNILKFVLPNCMACDVNKIWKVCAILTNFKGPLVV